MASVIRWSLVGSFLIDHIVVAVPFGDDQISVGCLFWGWTDSDANSKQSADIDTIPKCAKLCRDSTSCGVFKFIGSTKTCFIGDGEFGGNLVKAAEGDISGPGTCDFPAKACCAEIKTGVEFPAPTIDDAMNAWTTGFQPQATQCWERFENTSLMPCGDAVTDLGGLDDVKKCSGLVARPSLTEAQCKATCIADPTCSVWVIRSGSCMTGLGLECFSGLEVDATAGARLGRGSSRDLAPLKKEKISGTVLAFALSSESLATMTEEIAKKRCKDVCVSNVECQFWQLLEETGCWIEIEIGTSSSVYPLTTAANILNAGRIVDGGLIQHSCHSQMGATCPTSIASDLVKKAGTAAAAGSGASSGSGASGSGASGSGASGSGASGSGASGSGDSGSGSGDSGSGGSSESSDSSTSSGSESSGSTWPWWAWLLLLLLLCICIPVVAALLFGLGLCDKAKKKKKAKKTQLVEPAVVEPVQQREVAQPVYMVQQQVPVPTTVAQVPTFQTAQAPVQYVVPAAPVQYVAQPEAQPLYAMQQGPAQYAVPQAQQAAAPYAVPQSPQFAVQG